jgi:hypothetical protein
LSNVSSTLARLAGLRLVVPLKITSCMLSPRSSLALLSPRTQRTASMMLDLPQPFGPTTPTSCPGSMKLVGSAKDLKPESLMDWRRTGQAGVKEARGRESPESYRDRPARTGPARVLTFR